MHILIVEDEWILAGDLARFFADMGAIVLGPAASVAQAVAHTWKAEAAILDINLNGGRVFPIADELMRRGVPFVFFSGDEEIAIPEHLRYASTLRKSSGGVALVDALFAPRHNDPAAPAAGADDVFSLLPKLRLAARLLLTDVNASDRLVEHTLEHAIREVETRPAGSTTAEWLNGIMHNIACSLGPTLLH